MGDAEELGASDADVFACDVRCWIEVIRLAMINQEESVAGKKQVHCGDNEPSLAGGVNKSGECTDEVEP